MPSLLDIRKIPFDSLTLCAVVIELRALLVTGQIQDIRQPASADLQLGIRCYGKNFLLLLSCDSRFARIHLTAQRRPNAPQPPSFCMALRKHLENGIIRDVRQRGLDRIFEMVVETKDEEGTPHTTRLIAELMGKHSNLVLVHSDGTIIDSAKRISHRVNRVRETLPGLAYQSPPEQSDRLDPFDPATPRALDCDTAMTPLEQDNFAAVLTQRVAGMSPFLAQMLIVQANTPGSSFPEAWKQIFDATAQGQIAPVLVTDARGQVVGAYPFPLPVPFPGAQVPQPDLNTSLDTAFAAQIARASLEAVAGELRGKIDRELKRIKRQQQNVERALSEADRAETHKQAGELILGNLYRIEPGAPSIAVSDYYHPELAERTIALDPTLSAQENAEAYFKRYRKARDGQENALEYGVRLESAREQLEQAQTQLETATEVEAVRQLRAKLTSAGLLRGDDEATGEQESARGGPDFAGHKIRRFTAPEGYDIYVGETATANDFLTTRIAAPNDIWLHVRAATSAHVIIRSQGKPDQVPRSVLLRAAAMCAQHSAQKHSSLISVDYTLRKFVRKPRGAAPGSVDYQREKTLEITL